MARGEDGDGTVALIWANQRLALTMNKEKKTKSVNMYHTRTRWYFPSCRQLLFVFLWLANFHRLDFASLQFWTLIFLPKKSLGNWEFLQSVKRKRAIQIIEYDCQRPFTVVTHQMYTSIATGLVYTRIGESFSDDKGASGLRIYYIEDNARKIGKLGMFE